MSDSFIIQLTNVLLFQLESFQLTYIHMSSYICHATKTKTINPKGNYVSRLDFKTHHHSLNNLIPCIHSVTCTALRLEALALSRALDYNRIQSKSSRKVLVASSLSLKKRPIDTNLRANVPFFSECVPREGKGPFI